VIGELSLFSGIEGRSDLLDGYGKRKIFKT